MTEDIQAALTFTTTLFVICEISNGLIYVDIVCEINIQSLAIMTSRIN